jgi:hypothetical protein
MRTKEKCVEEMVELKRNRKMRYTDLEFLTEKYADLDFEFLIFEFLFDF